MTDTAPIQRSEPAFLATAPFDHLLAQVFSPTFYRGYRLLNQLCYRMSLNVVAHYQLFAGPRRRADFDSIATQIGVAVESRYLLGCVLRLLVEEQCLLRQGNAWLATSALDVALRDCATAVLYREAHELCPDEPLFTLLARCESSFFAVLERRQKGIEVIFPNGDGSVWSALHRQSLFMSPYTQLAAFVVNACRQPAAAILEVGAGTGAATALVLAPPGAPIARYTFSDIGLSFLRHGRRRFAGWPFMQFQHYNLDQDAARQELSPNSFDIVFGVNVVHVAQDIPATLRQFYRLLRPGGYLILGEGSPPNADTMWRPDLVFGFLAGWWKVVLNPIYRPHPGFLLPGDWKALFAEAGFVDVTNLPTPDYFPAGCCYGGVIVGRTQA
jgi:SAM-dependent methyltransferase